MKKFFLKSGPYSLAELAEEFGLDVYKSGNKYSLRADIFIDGIDTLEASDENSISFLANKKYIEAFKKTKAAACVCAKEFIELAPKDLVLLISDNPYASFAKISSKFYNTVAYPSDDTSPQAIIHETATIGEGCEIMSGAYIDKNAKIGTNVKIFPNVYIGQNVEIGNNCVISHGCTIQYAVIGNNCLIHPGARIGQDGFGFAMDKGRYIKVPQIGHVIIGNNVEIGANTTIDRGTIQNTIIKDMCQIDNLVQIAHNVELGIGCVLAAQVGISGSSKLGNYVQAGGQGGIAGHVKIGDQAQIAAQAGIISDVEPKEVVAGMPHQPIKQFFRQMAMLKKLASKKEKK
ncbi:MAG: UDP-3-O-(3-hydroxymyristoyl)glucosamine N-acyltransferase [Rickettsiales bacterium]